MRILAHRGASGYAPENTLTSFDLACRMGAAVLETDVRLTGDGVPVLIHDERVDRTTDATGLVAELDWTRLAGMDAGAWFGRAFAGERVPRLEPFLDRYADHVGLCLEVKLVAAVSPVVELVRARGIARFRGLEFSSFEWDVAIALREAFADLPVGLLVRPADTTLETLGRAADAGLAMFGPSAGVVSPELVRAAHGRGMSVRTWGVRNRADFDRAVAAGADGTTLNWPDWRPRAPSRGVA